jgi:hypothetical protein
MCEVTSITRACGTATAGLIGMYLIDVLDVVSIPAANDDWIIENDIIIKPNKSFKEIKFREQKAGLADDLADAVGGGFKKNIGLFIPKYGNKSNQWVYNMIGTRFIMLIQDFNQQTILVGNLTSPMRMEKATGNTGQKLGDDNGWAVNIIAESNRPCYLYTGQIIIDENEKPIYNVGTSLKYRINLTGTGIVDDDFDGYLQAGLTVTIPSLAGHQLSHCIVNSQIYQDFSSTGVEIGFDGTELDFTKMGGLRNGDYLIIVLKQ